MADDHTDIRIWIIFISSLGKTDGISSQHPNISDVDRLIKDKRADYNVFLRPKTNQSETLEIGMVFSLVAIRDFDEVKERFSVVGSFYMVWRDDRMTWDPAEYGKLRHLIIEHRDFWVPPVIMVNAFEEFKKLGAEEFWPIRFFHSGNVLYQPGQLFTATCSVNVELYPFDTQKCELLFSAWAHTEDDILLTAYHGQNKVYLPYYNENGEWDLVDTSAGRVSSNLFSFGFVMKRKPTFFVINILIPIILLAFLNILAFLIPIDSGERLSYCITVLLAVTVFLTIIGDSLPQSATSIAVLCYYLLSILCLSMLSILGTIASMRLLNRGEDIEVSGCWVSFVNFIKCRCCSKTQTINDKRTQSTLKATTSEFTLYRGNKVFDFSQNRHKNDDIGIGNGKTNHENKKNGWQGLESISVIKSGIVPEYPFHMNGIASVYINEESTNGHSGTNSLELEQEREDYKYTWKDVCESLDVLFFVMAFIVLTFVTSLFFIYTTSSKEYIK